MRPLPLAAACVLAAVSAAAQSLDDIPLGRTNWGKWTASGLKARLAAGGSDPISKNLRGVLKHAADDDAAGVAVTPLSSIHLEGTLSNAPEYGESSAALKSVDPVLRWAFCARVAPDAGLSARCRARAEDGIAKWVRAYAPDGNPINESRLIPLLRAIDLLHPAMTASDRRDADAWAESLIAAGDRRKAGYSPKDSRGVNNWETWRLAVRAVAAAAARDDARIAETRGLFERQAAGDILDDGSTYDFHQRDALHYHVYDLEAFVDAALFVPDSLGGGARARVSKAFAFLKPYATGEKTHREFVGTTVKFDLQRKAAGLAEYQNAAWDPKGARAALRAARVVFPEVRDWTGDLVDEHYDPMLKLTAALNGD